MLSPLFLFKTTNQIFAEDIWPTNFRVRDESKYMFSELKLQRVLFFTISLYIKLCYIVIYEFLTVSLLFYMEYKQSFLHSIFRLGQIREKSGIFPQKEKSENMTL